MLSTEYAAFKCITENHVHYECILLWMYALLWMYDHISMFIYTSTKMGFHHTTNEWLYAYIHTFVFTTSVTEGQVT